MQPCPAKTGHNCWEQNYLVTELENRKQNSVKSLDEIKSQTSLAMLEKPAPSVRWHTDALLGDISLNIYIDISDFY